MGKSDLEKNILTLGNAVLKAVGLATIGFFLYSAGASLYNYCNKTNIEQYTDYIRVKAGYSKENHRMVVIKPSYVSWDKTSYLIGAVDLNDDEVFQEDELFDSRDGNLPIGLDSTFYANHFDYFFVPETLDRIFESVAPYKANVPMGGVLK